MQARVALLLSHCSEEGQNMIKLTAPFFECKLSLSCNLILRARTFTVIGGNHLNDNLGPCSNVTGLQTVKKVASREVTMVLRGLILNTRCT